MEEKYYRVNKMNYNLAIAHPNIAVFRVPFLAEFEFENVGFWREGNTAEPGEKPLRAKNNKLKPRMASTPGIEMLSPDHFIFPYSLIYRENFVDLLKEKRF